MNKVQALKDKLSFLRGSTIFCLISIVVIAIIAFPLTSTFGEDVVITLVVLMLGAALIEGDLTGGAK